MAGGLGGLKRRMATSNLRNNNEVISNLNFSFAVRLGSRLWFKTSNGLYALRIPDENDEKALRSFLYKASNFGFDTNILAKVLAENKYVRPLIHFAQIVNPAIVVTAPLDKPLSLIGKERALYSILFARAIQNSESWFLLFDDKARANHTQTSLALEELNFNEVMEYFNKNSEQIRYILYKAKRFFHLNLEEDDTEEKALEQFAKYLVNAKRAYRIVPALKDPSFLKEIDWQNDVVEKIANWKNKKDERLALIQKAHLLRGLYPKINPHALTVTPPGTGKTTFYELVGVNLGRVTAKSFTGFAKSPLEVFHGIVHEEDRPINVDEIENEGAFFIAQHLNNILEEGYDRIGSGAVTFENVCYSVFNFSANPEAGTKDKTKSFGTLLLHLSSNPSIGRRIALILYIPQKDDKLKQISKKLSKEDEEQLQALVELFRLVEEYARPKIDRIIEEAWSWINEPMPWYENEVLKVVSQLEEAPQNVIEFLKAHVYSTSRIRAAALFIAIAENLNKIALEDVSEELVEQLLEEAQETLGKLAEINLESIKNISNSLSEELETAASIFYETAPEYFKVILEACVAFKQKNPDADKVQVTEIQYETKVQKYQYLSQAVDRLKRVTKTELLEGARRLFGIDFVFQEGQLFAYFVNQNYTKIKPRGQIVQQHLSDIGEIEKSEKLRSCEEGEKVGASFIRAIHKDSTVSEAKIDGEIGETKIIKNQVSILEKNLLSKPKTPENHELEEKEQKVKVSLQVSNQKEVQKEQKIKQEAKNVEKDHEFLKFSSFSISQIVERIRKTKALPLKKSLCWRCFGKLSPEDQKQYELTNRNGVCDICGFWEVGLYELKEAS